MNPYRRTDLAAELYMTDRTGIDEQTEGHGPFTISAITIATDEAAARLGKPKGQYITFDLGRIWLASDEDFDTAAHLIADRLCRLAADLCGSMPDNILIAGLGNRRITADAIGDEAVGLLTVTRHIKPRDSRLFHMLGGREISAVTPGVLGQTGIETVELIKGACEHVKPRLVIAIDALCARSTERLATTLQLGSSGISPGSGIGNRRRSIDEETLGVPVIALGIPTVVDSSTLVLDALERAGLDADRLPGELHEVLRNGRSFFVTPKETDTIVRELSRLTARSLELAFQSG